jgi:hypothetical protein
MLAGMLEYNRAAIVTIRHAGCYFAGGICGMIFISAS